MYTYYWQFLYLYAKIACVNENTSLKPGCIVFSKFCVYELTFIYIHMLIYIL
jgi:hypothetical protein